MPSIERPLAVSQREVRDSRASLAHQAEGLLCASQCAAQIVDPIRRVRVRNSHKRGAVATERCRSIEHDIESRKVKRLLRPMQRLLHRVPQTARSTAQCDGHVQHPGGARGDAAGWRSLPAQLQLPFDEFRKLSRIRIQREEAWHVCGKAGETDLAPLQRIGKEIVHVSKNGTSPAVKEV